MRIRRGSVALVLQALALLALAAPVRGQDALSGVGPETEVASIEFRFEDGPTLDEADLRRRIALTARGGLAGLRDVLAFIPFVPAVGVHPFDPLELGRDGIRLRNYYQRSGFPKVEVRYDVRFDAAPNRVQVAFVIREGPPLAIAALDFVGDTGALAVPSELESEWSDFVEHEREQAERYGETERLALADSTARWFRHAGYPFAVAEPVAEIDTAANTADVTVHVRPGVRARIREVVVRGNSTVSAHHLVRPLPVGAGDWYDGSALEKGRQQLVQLDIVRHATLHVPEDSAHDSTVAVRLDVAENPPHLIRGEVGVGSGGGLSAEAHWTHRSFLGGLRTFTLGVAAQSGVLSLTDPPEQLYRASATVFQPFVGDRHLSVAGGPFVEYRNDLRDRSQAIGFEGTVVYASGPLRSISLGYTISHRRVLDYGFGEDLDPSDYLPLLGLATPAGVGSLDTTRNRSVLSLEGSWGRLDRFANPREGYVLRPRIEVTTPGFNTSEYFLAELAATLYLPLTDRIGFTVRGSGGRIVPFGRSVEDAATESPFISLLRLRDVTFAAGGTRDVRGWGSQLAGPKLPEIRVLTEENEAGEAVTDTIAERYTPVGGLARLTGSLEMQLPLPLPSDKWKSFVFLDGARVWTPDSRFALNAGVIDQDDFFASTGVGVGYETIVGAVQFALGYKLNPSELDQRSPQAVLDALSAGQSIESVPTESRRRWHLHFSIGATF
ncbi:MAG: BamA/OMP85 family outer membrane protein [Gemmatimonadales bacterium]